jgi:hypothetical protein
MNHPYSVNLMDLGRIELGEAIELLSTFKTTKDRARKMGRHISSEVTISFDSNNGIVYLADELGNLARMEDGFLVDCERIR